MMTRESFWGTVFAAYMLGGIVFSSCSNEMMEVNDGVSTFAEEENEALARTSGYGYYENFTFTLWADLFQDRVQHCIYLKDLYDIRISFSPNLLEQGFEGGKYYVRFHQDCNGNPINYVESRRNNCHAEPDAVSPTNAGSALADIVFTKGWFNGVLDEKYLDAFMVLIQLHPKPYISDMIYKPRLIISKKPLSELCYRSGTTLHVIAYFDNKNEDYFYSFEYDEQNPPEWVIEPQWFSGKMIYADGTERDLYPPEEEFNPIRTRLPKYDGMRYDIDNVANNFDNTDCDTIYKYYYDADVIVPLPGIYNP